MPSKCCAKLHNFFATGTLNEDWQPPYKYKQQKKVGATKKVIKDLVAGRIDTHAHFLENAKKVKIKVTVPKKTLSIFGEIDQNFFFFSVL